LINYYFFNQNNYLYFIFNKILKNSICKAIEEVDGVGKFKEDAWIRDNGGGGVSRQITLSLIKKY